MAYDNVSILCLSGLQVNAAVAGPAFVYGPCEKTKHLLLVSENVLSHIKQI